MPATLDPITPGEILIEECFRPQGMIQNQLARSSNVPAVRINGIVRGTRSITPDIGLNLPPQYDARTATRKHVPLLRERGRVRSPKSA